MSKLVVHNLNTSGVKIPVNVEGWLPNLKVAIEEKVLTMFHEDGMYWLLPMEVQKELVMLVEYRNATENDYSMMLPVNITLEQCIPIPSETAKILMEL